MKQSVAVIVLLGYFASLVACLGGTPSIRAVIGSELVNTTINTLVAKALAKDTRIPLIEQEIEFLFINYEINLTDVHVFPTTFDQKQTGVSLDKSGQTLKLAITNLKNQLSTNFAVKGGIVRSTGNFTSNIVATCEVSINLQEPSVDVDIEYQDFDIQIEGTFGAKVLNTLTKLFKFLLKKQIGKILGSTIQGQLENLYTNPFTQNLEVDLSAIPFLLQPILKLGANLTLTNAFNVQSSSQVEFNSVGYFYNPTDNTTSPISPESLPTISLDSSQNFGVVLNERAVNSLFWVLSKTGFSNFRVNNTLLNKTVLTTNTFRYLIPDLYKQYGAGKDVNLDISDLVGSSLAFADGTLNINFPLTIKASVLQDGKLDEAFTVSFDASAGGNPYMSESMLLVNLTSIKLQNAKKSGKVDVPVETLVKLLNGSLKNLLSVINEELPKFLNIPNFTNGKLKIEGHTLAISGKVTVPSIDSIVKSLIVSE